MSLTFAELLDRWLELKRSQGRSPTTIERYHYAIVKLESLGAVPLSRITPLVLDTLYARLLHDGLGPSSVAKVHLVCHGALKQAVRWRMISENPATFCVAPRVRTMRADERTPSLSDLDVLLSEALRNDFNFAVLLLTAAASGARRGELAALQWRDLEGESLFIRKGVVTVAGSTQVRETKTYRVRKVTLDARSVTALNQLRSMKGGLPDHFIFGGEQPLRPDSITQHFGRLRDRVKLPQLTMHSLRHFHVTLLIANGLDPVATASRVGHARTSVTLDLYAHALPGRDDAAASIVDAALSQLPSHPWRA